MTNIQSFISNELGNWCHMLLPLDATSFANGYPTAKELLYSAAGKDSASNSYAMHMSAPHMSGCLYQSDQKCMNMRIHLMHSIKSLALKCENRTFIVLYECY
jgi:hypothetical protein